MSLPQSDTRADYALAAGEGGVDRTWYLQRYPDVLAAGVDPVEHYLWAGWKEGRDPRADFSTQGYLHDNLHVASNPLVHYLRHGGGKIPTPEWKYAQDYNLASSEGGVDRNWYLQTYTDVAAAGLDPVGHYLRQGWHEGRDPRADFSTLGYLGANKDVGSNPLIHYLRSKNEAESLTSEWHALWNKGFLHPKKNQKVPRDVPFGSQGAPKIVFTGHEASRTGAPLILLRLMEGLQALTGAELYLILERGGPLLHDYQQIAHVCVNHNGMFYRQNGPDLAKMLASIAGPKPELAICNSADGWRLVRALRETGMAYIVSLIHERVVHYSPEIWRIIHRNSDQIIYPAHAVKAAATSVVPELQSASVVPQGLLNPDFGLGPRHAARQEVRERLGLSPESKIVLGCGSQDMRKGVDLFVQLAHRVRARNLQNVHFVWVGAVQPVSPFSKFLELDVSLLNLSEGISLVDEVTDTEPYFLAADAYALTSRDDPFPCVIHEAMACALPIVAFDQSGGTKEAVAQNCGLIVPYLDIEAMASTLVALLDDPQEATDLGRRAEARVRSVYRFSDYVQRIWSLCENVTASPGVVVSQALE